MLKFTQEEIDKINSNLKTPEDALSWAFDTLHDKVAKASSFGAEDAVITDMMIKLNPKARFYIGHWKTKPRNIRRNGQNQQKIQHSF